jgi:DnaK suppressor protein
MSDSIFSDDERNELREFMQAELQRLDAEIATLMEMTAPVSPDPAIGRLSRLEAMNEKGVNEAALRSAQGRGALIRAALRHVDDDEFGLCAECGDAIPFARIRSMPGTRVCVPCAEKAGG